MRGLPSGRILISLVLAALPAAADSLSDLRLVLQRFPGKAPFTVEASLRATGKSQEVAPRVGSASFDVHSGPDGLTIRLPPAMLATSESEAESKKRDPDSPTPVRTAMLALTVLDVIEALDAAAALTNDIDGAALIDRTASAYGGKPATLLRIKVKPTLAGTRSRIVKEPVIELRLWVDSNGIPVAAERDSNFSASIVVASAVNVRNESWEFAVAGDRLYASRSDRNDRASAAGKSVASSRSLTYTPK